MKIQLLFLLVLGSLSFSMSCKQTNIDKENEDNSLVQMTTPKVNLQDEGKIRSGSFAHVVYFWLKNPESQHERKIFTESLRTFIDQSPNITTHHIGTPVTKERDVVDASFSYSLVLSFKDKAAHDRYQEEDAHQILRDEIGPLVERFIVYDSESIYIVE